MRERSSFGFRIDSGSSALRKDTRSGNMGNSGPEPLNSRQLNSYVILRIAYCDFILVDGYISGVCGPWVEPGANRGGGPGGARAVF